MTTPNAPQSPGITDAAYWQGVPLGSPVIEKGTSAVVARELFVDPFIDYMQRPETYRRVDAAVVLRQLIDTDKAPKAKILPAAVLPWGAIVHTTDLYLVTRGYKPFFDKDTTYRTWPRPTLWTPHDASPGCTTIPLWGRVLEQRFEDAKAQNENPTTEDISVMTQLYLGKWMVKFSAKVHRRLVHRKFHSVHIPEEAYDGWMQQYGEPKEAPST